MGGKQLGGIACLVLAVFGVFVAVASLTRGDGPAVDDPSGEGVSRAVGAFLPPLFALIIGLWLLKPPPPRDPDDGDEDDEDPRPGRRRKPRGDRRP